MARLGLQGVLFGKAQMSAGLGALQYHKVRDAVVVPVPELADQARGPSAADDGCQGGVALRHLRRNGGQVLGEPRAADHGVHPRPEGGTDALGVLGGGHHGVDGHETGALGQLLGVLHLALQSPEIGGLGVLLKIRLLEAAEGGGDGAHAAAGGHGSGQAVQADAHAHAALQNGEGELLPANHHCHSRRVASRTAFPPSYSSSKIWRTGLISWSIPAT